MEEKRETNFWDVVNKHPFWSTVMLSMVVDAAINIACIVFGDEEDLD